MNRSTPGITPLRQRMLEDMHLRKLEPKTQTCYVRAVRRLAEFLERSPDTATAEDLRLFQLHLVDQGTSPITLNATLTGLKFFFGITLGRGEVMAKTSSVRVPQTLPVVLSRDEVARLIGAVTNLKHQTALTVAYGAGLRAGEVIALKVSDIDSQRWVACRPGFFLSVRVLSRLFRRRFLEELMRAYQAGKLQFFAEHAALVDANAFKAWLAPLHQCEWVVYAKRPFAGPQSVLAYLSRYTHRVAISNSRLIAMDERGVAFRWKDYRVKNGNEGRTRHKTMTLEPGEFMLRFLLHVLPGGFHRIRHYGLLANGRRKTSLALARQLLCQPAIADVPADGVDHKAQPPTFVCWHCGHAMAILQTFTRGHAIRAPPVGQAQ